MLVKKKQVLFRHLRCSFPHNLLMLIKYYSSIRLPFKIVKITFPFKAIFKESILVSTFIESLTGSFNLINRMMKNQAKYFNKLKLTASVKHFLKKKSLYTYIKTSETR